MGAYSMKIYVEEHGGLFRIMVHHPLLGYPTPAGPRLLRLHPPQIRFSHEDRKAAFIDAAKLDQHIKLSPSLKQKKRKDLD